MNPHPYTEDNYLHEQLGWESVYAYNNEDFGLDRSLGCASDREKHKFTNGDIV